MRGRRWERMEEDTWNPVRREAACYDENRISVVPGGKREGQEVRVGTIV